MAPSVTLEVERLRGDCFVVPLACLLSMGRKGCVQSLEFLKKSWNLPSNFPDLEKVWKMVKSRELFFLFYFYLFFKLQATTSALLDLGEICFILVKSSSILPLPLQRIMKKALLLPFLKSLSITYLITLSLKKEIIMFWKKVWKNSWFLDPKISTNPGRSM